ncbi:hypothetical protein B566_EDAN014911 [Ephemera danica]|nr:hypothetical protein B566_EDAN014911 [Ephemera danica]
MAVSEDLESKQENTHLKEIEEFIFDQDLVISYKKLSKLLNIHVNKAKRLLNVFVENANSGKRPISVTYVVSGEQTSNLENNVVNPWRVCVVPEKKLEATKQLFQPDTVSVHVFSVHQGSEVRDNAMLLEASRCSGYSSGISAIRNKNAVPYDDEQMQQLMKKVQLTATVQVPIGFANKKPAPEVTKPVAKEPPAKKIEVKPEESKEKEDTKNVTKQGGGTISGMFAAQSNNKAAPSKPATTTTATNNKKGGKKVAGTSSITSFFQRQKDAPTKSSPPQKKEEAVVKTEQESEKSDDNAKECSSPEQKNMKSSPSQSEAIVTNGKGKGTSNSKASKTANKRPASKSQNKKKDDTAKRRKRIIALTDSESSDEESKDEEMQVDSPPPPVSVEVEDEQPAVQEKPSEGIIKERRLVDKVYQDEKGFIVTKKEWVVETRKVEELPEKETKKSPEKEKPAPVKRKQQSDIMSFFGRK